jgi:hypothetical protein
LLEVVAIERKNAGEDPDNYEIQNGAVAKSYMTNGLLIYREMFAHFLIYQEAFPHILYDFATAPILISLHMRKI